MVFVVNWSSMKIYLEISLTKLWLASIGEPDTCEWLCLAHAKLYYVAPVTEIVSKL